MLYYFVPPYHSPILPNSVNSIHVLFYPIVCNLYFYLILAHTISSSIPSCFTLYSIIICAILIPALSYHSWSGIPSPHPHLFNFILSVQHVSCILRRAMSQSIWLQPIQLRLIPSRLTLCSPSGPPSLGSTRILCNFETELL